MTWVMVDVEADGPCPGLFSMISLGAMIVDYTMDKTFYAQLAPISLDWDAAALAVTGFTREECLGFPLPMEGMHNFSNWLNQVCATNPMFISDNNGFDWQFVNYYCWRFLGANPFGHSSMNLGSFYKGLEKNISMNFKRWRKTKHTHHPVDDCRGNVEALLKMIDIYKCRLPL